MDLTPKRKAESDAKSYESLLEEAWKVKYEQAQSQVESLRKALADADEALMKRGIFREEVHSLHDALDQAQREAAAMREALEKLRDHHCCFQCVFDSSVPPKETEHERLVVLVNASLSSTAGAGYLSPEEVQQIVGATRGKVCADHQGITDAGQIPCLFCKVEKTRLETLEQTAKLAEDYDRYEDGTPGPGTLAAKIRDLKEQMK